MKKDIKVGRQTITIKENAVDRIVRYFNPIKGEQRFKSRMTSALVSGYSGASKSKRSMAEWDVSGGDADSDILPDLPTLRDRSSDLARNTPVATSALNTAVTNVVGTGLKLQSRIDRDYLKLSEDAADNWEATAEREFKLWAESKDSDAARTVNFYGQQHLAFLSALERGDIFYLTPEISRKNSPYSLALQSIEADRVSNKDWQTDTPELAGGVRVDKYGAPIAYHILKTHPGNAYDPGAEWTEVPAYGNKTGRLNVIHLFDIKRPGQKRGVPYLAPVMESLKQLGRYTEAELMAAVVSGMFTVFVESESSGLDVLADQTQANTDDLALGNGMVVDLNPGEKITSADPGRPNTAFDPFVQSILKQVGSALEIPFELLVKQFNSSYSASKAAFVEAWKFFNSRRAWMVRGFCNPVYELWMDEAVSLGRIKAPGYFNDPMIKKSYLGAMWVGPGKGSINEGAEVDAAIKRVDSGLSTLAKESAELDGSDFDANHRQRVKENNKRIEDGLAGSVSQPEQAPNGSTPDDSSDGDDSDEDEDDSDDNDDEEDDQDKETAKLIENTADRLSKKETKAASDEILKNSSDEDFNTWANEFYTHHAEDISAYMNIELAKAKRYADNSKTALIHFRHNADIKGFNNWASERFGELRDLPKSTESHINPPVYVTVGAPVIHNVVNAAKSPDVSVTVEGSTLDIPAPVVNVEQPDIQIPETVVNVSAPNVEIQPPNITVEAAEPEPTPVVVNVPAPVVNVTNEVEPAEVNVENKVDVNIPDADREVTFNRDKSGKITGAVISDD